MSEGSAVHDRHKRKRKKSFLKNARKYAKKGCYGRGSELDADTYQYLVRAMETFREGFSSEEDKIRFANNALEQADNNEVSCICNQVGCRVVEQLIPFANDKVLLQYMNAVWSNIRPLCSDRFASHVIEALLTEACSRSLKPNIDEEFKKSYFEFTLKISKFLLNNIEDFMWDVYGNHIGRSVLGNLSQLKHEDTVSVEQIPDEYKEVVKDYAEHLILWPQFKEFPVAELPSAFIQVLLKALKRLHPKLLKKYLKKLLEECFLDSDVKEEEISNKLPKVFMSNSAIILLETALQVAKSKMYTQIYAKCFVGRLAQLAKMRSTNFAVQKLLGHCEERTEFEAMFDELQNDFKEILECGHTGVLLALAQTCKRLTAKQSSFVKQMMRAMDCYEPEERQNDFVLCMSRLISYEKNKETSNENLQKDKLNLHGTLMLQLMLEFNKPSKIVNSILNMQAGDVKNLFSNSMGSHIVDSFVRSSFVGEKNKEKLIKKLKGFYQELAASKYGSRAFDALWSAANFNMKSLIMEELAEKEGAWSNTEYGTIVIRKVNLALYKRNKGNWKNYLEKGNKVDSLLKLME